MKKLINVFAVVLSGYAIYSLFVFIPFILGWFNWSQWGIVLVSILFTLSLLFILVGSTGVLFKKVWSNILYLVSLGLMVLITIINSFIPNISNYITTYVFLILVLIIICLIYFDSRRSKATQIK